MVLTLLFAPLSYGEIQIRFSEALTILPFFYTGCDSGVICGMYHCQSLWRCHSCRHYFFGSIATLIGAVFTHRLPQLQPFSCADPADCFQCSHRAIRTSLRIRVNLPIPLMMLTVGIGEVVSCGVVGLILQTALLKYKNVIFRSQRTV